MVVRKAIGIGVIPLAMFMAAGVIWHASYAAFSGSTRNSGNSWSTGTVSLTDDDAGTARFNVVGLTPGQSETKCITVSSHSNVPGEVRTYYLNAIRSAQGLEDHIMITGRIGTGGGFGSCSGFVADGPAGPETSLASLIDTNYDYASGAPGWTTTGTPGESKTYEITYRFDVTGLSQAQLDALQGAHVGADVEWEIQSL